MKQLNLALVALLRGFALMRFPRLLLPVAVLTLAQLVVLFLLTNFYQRPFVSWMAPIIRATAGEGALHYPDFFIAFPSLFNLANLVLTAFLGAYIWGVALLAVVGHLEGGDRRPWGDAAERFPALFLAQLPIILVAVALLFGPRLILGDAPIGGTRLRLMLYGLPLVFMLFQAMFLFAPMRVLVEHIGPLPAIRDSVSMWRTAFLATFIVVLLPSLLHAPLQWMLRHRDSIATRFSHETIALVMATDVVLFLVTNFVLVTAATVTYQTKKGEL
jgi:hypothetical protein